MGAGNSPLNQYTRSRYWRRGCWVCNAWSQPGQHVAVLKGEIYELYLKPEYQGVGFGKKLFSLARQELAHIGMKGCVVWALEENDSALNFYMNAGGRDIAEGNETFDGASLKKIAFAWD